MTKKPKRCDVVATTRVVDMSATGGPVWEQGQQGVVVKAQYDGRLWIDWGDPINIHAFDAEAVEVISRANGKDCCCI